MQGLTILVAAIVCEVIGTTFMKLSEGFTKPWPIIGIIVFYIGAIVCLTMALKHVPMNSAYAIWSGLGTVSLALIGAFFFAEHISLARTFFIGLVVVGVLGINLVR